MSWRVLEKELVDIIRSEGFETNENSNTGDKYVTTGNVDDLNLTYLAKELMRRGIGQGTPR